MFYKIENNKIVNENGFIEEILQDNCKSFFQVMELEIFDKWLEKQDGWLENQIKLSQNTFNIQELQWKNKNDVDYETKLQSLFQEKQELSKFRTQYSNNYFIVENNEIMQIVDNPILQDGWFDINSQEYINTKKVIDKKAELTKLLEEKYEKTKTIYVENGNSFVLTAQDKEYDQFRKIVEESINTTKPFVKKTLQIIKENDIYTITLMNYVWDYVFFGSQKNRENNKLKYDKYFNLIQNITIDNFDKASSISFDFDSADGFTVNVSEITNKMIQEISTTPVEVQIEMQSFVASSNDGTLHLVKKQSNLL